MLQLRHNGRESILDSNTCPNIGQAIESCTGAAGEPTAILVSVRIDGCEIPEEAWDELRTRPSGGIRELEIESRELAEVARSSLQQACEYAPEIEKALRQIADLLRNGEIERANALYAVLLDGLSVLVFAVSSAATQLGRDATGLQGLDASLSPWLESLHDAHRRKDWICVADYLEYEVAPIIAEWRVKAEAFTHCGEESA